MSLEINFIYDDDVMFRCERCGEILYLSNLISDEIENTERYLCEANAKDIYKLICLLELKANELRKHYEGWKHNDFKREDKNEPR